VRLDLNILNHEGNLIDCASVAALASLSHFRRPDVELTGDELIIHEASVKEPIPLGIRHSPVCVSFAIFNKGY
jgi:exosome complex component RRP45